MGFGFVEFDSVETATKVCKDLQVSQECGQNYFACLGNFLKFIPTNIYLFQGTILDGHQLILQHCHAKQDEVPKKVVKEKSSTKLLVKNVAFQATKKDLRQLFSTYGEVITKFLYVKKKLNQL